MHREYDRLLKECVAKVRTTIHPDQTVEEALRFLRSKHIDEEIIYIYVVDEERRLVGVVSTRNLLLSESETPVSAIMSTSIVTLRGEQTLKEAMTYLETHRLLALPVVDGEQRLLGAIHIGHYVHRKVDVETARRRDDLFQMLGLSIAEDKKGVWSGYRTRMPWIFCNMIGGFICAAVSHAFEMTLKKLLVLAMFIPLLLTLSESISMQSMAQSMHFAGRKRSAFIRFFLHEWRVTALLALSSGIIVALVSLLWGDGIVAALPIGCGIVLSVTLASAIGAIVPVMLRKGNRDPRVAAGPIVLMFADVLTTSIYLFLGTLCLLAFT
ncbi:MAG: CBS domain-containing protein [Simkaniaceae bacterium]|nr:CBS domain-containing protein [Simkaniaceae bacterium]